MLSGKGAKRKEAVVVKQNAVICKLNDAVFHIAFFSSPHDLPYPPSKGMIKV
jgi:hypothetical protein